MRNGAEPLTQGCFGLMVCLVAEAIRWNSPLQVDPEPSGRIQFEVLRSPAVSSAAPNPARDRISTIRAHHVQMRPETGFVLWLSDAACGILCHGTKSTPSDRRGSIRRRGRSGRRYAEVARFRGIFRVAPPLAAYASWVISFRRPRWGGRIRLGAI